MPFVPADLLRALVEHRRRFTAFAAVPVTDAPTGMEPFCACYAAACGPALDRVLHAGTHGAAAFVRSLPRVSWLSRAAVEAFGDPARTFLSVNTREDLARAQSLLQPAG
jgi:molybdopterin-guanine dinucleotide biosynthesis protein A